MPLRKRLMSHLFLLLLHLLSSLQISFTGASEIHGAQNPFTPKAYLIRYWTKSITNDLPKSQFLLSKASPLNAVDWATFTKLAEQNTLSSHLPEFCSSAKLLCFPDSSPSLEKHGRDTNFASYLNKNFTNYGTGALVGRNSFNHYSDGDNLPVDSFRRYSRDSVNHKDQFSNYAPDSNVVDQSFDTYGTGATGGVGNFINYNNEVNVPNLRFNSYGTEGVGRGHSFATYTDDTNAGAESFMSYGKKGLGGPNEFKSYGKDSNVIGSGFTGYGESGNAGNDSFTSYGDNGNVPENTFKSYGDSGNAGIDSFTSYRDQSNVGDDSFQSYAKNSNSAMLNFANYGQSFNEGTDKFTGYGQRAKGLKVGFKIYGVNTTFKEYAKNGVTFSEYTNVNSTAATMAGSGNLVNKWVEPGKFFRESMLKQGTVMPMPDIRDKMPRRSFLPRGITSKLPFSTAKISELKRIFHAGDNSTMESMIMDALNECERAPAVGETKRCVGSAEDLIDFATSVLGRNVVVRCTENVNGSKKNIMIGSVRGINGGKVTKSVSCHQSLFPYLLYYCHSVPKVRVYEADILDANSKVKINHGVAICHLDTSAWSPGHGAFWALGSGPGRIEVCHWIFENDMTWTTAD